MRGRHITAMLVLNFAIAIVTGIFVGRFLTLRADASVSPVAAPGASGLAGQLQLSTEQSAKMRPIWETARDVAQECARDAERIQQENDAALQALLTEPQRVRYEQISADHHSQIAEQDARRKDAFRKAVDQTRLILRPDQWQAYEQILKNQIGSIP